MPPPEEKVLFGDIRDNEESMKKVIELLFHKAEMARRNPGDFFTFVMREETTRKHMLLAAHQKVLFDFVMAHEKCVIMLPVGHSKTFCMGALAMWFMGHNPTTRGAIVSATQLQAMKPLGMVKDYIEQSAELKMVFPQLKRSSNSSHAWTQTAITVERPMGIKDHSLVALGVDGAIAGSRLNFILVDDILNRENTATPEQRAKIYEWFDSSVLSRLDPKGSRVIVTNTAWHSRDLVHELKNLPNGKGWPTLKMATTGEVTVFNTDFGCDGLPGADDLRDAWTVGENQFSDEVHCRLTEHDPDEENQAPLWPERFPAEVIQEIRDRHLPIEFSRAYLNECRNEEDAMCKKEWTDRCKLLGRGMTMVSEYRGPDATFTGVDLAVSPNEGSDSVAFFTFRVLPNGQRLILDVDIGRFDGPTIVKKIIQKSTAYNSVVRVENNGAQDFIRQYAQTEAGIAIKAHCTGRTKAHPEHGVPGLFLELYQGAWIIPSSANGTCHPHVQRWVDECLEYNPSHHTGDSLMACYFAREQCKQFGLAWGNDMTPAKGGGIGAALMSR